ncbi:hypothetical protein EH228_04170 [Erwinia endophytica]|uniref:fimbrial protein n=1 Tax=Erwinia endophytica TaxID=1563158 RepID=UPI001265F54B|nr:hypothetical protein [Erwinia endophytica]KAB8313331.1 hypothetical protein EH228_04170 [Erwinia endophytica]
MLARTNHASRSVRWSPGILCSLIVLLSTCVLPFSQVHAADSVTLTLNYTVIQGTCSVSVGSNQDATDGQLNFYDVQYAWKSTDSWNQISLKPFYVKLSQCWGSPSSATQPMLTITGATDTATEDSVNSSFMFVDNAKSSSTGFGFVIFNTATNPVTNNAVPDINSSESDARKYIAIPGKGKGTAVTSDTVVTLSAAVTCGSTCSQGGNVNPNLRTGSINGAVTFNFLYH